MIENVKIVSTRLVHEKSVEYKVPKLNSPEAVYILLQKMIEDEPQECFVVLCLSAKGQLNNMSIVHRGGVNKSIVDMSAVFRTAILSNSPSIIVAHNHPSGDSTPSNDDIETTRALDSSSKIIGINLLDHIIIGRNKYFSFKEKGLL